jgi:hypothetical protein
MSSYENFIFIPEESIHVIRRLSRTPSFLESEGPFSGQQQYVLPWLLTHVQHTHNFQQKLLHLSQLE